MRTTNGCEPERIALVSDRSKSSQRWLKLRTTVQLTSVMASATQKKQNAALKREDSFIQRFSTRQLPEAQVRVHVTKDVSIYGSEFLQRPAYIFKKQLILQLYKIS